MVQVSKDTNINQDGKKVEDDQIVPFLGLAAFDDLFFQAPILLNELIQTEIKLAADSYQVANIRYSFSAFPAGNGLSLSAKAS